VPVPAFFWRREGLGSWDYTKLFEECQTSGQFFLSDLDDALLGREDATLELHGLR
jgi:hypothetical protein